VTRRQAAATDGHSACPAYCLVHVEMIGDSDGSRLVSADSQRAFDFTSFCHLTVSIKALLHRMNNGSPCDIRTNRNSRIPTVLGLTCGPKLGEGHSDPIDALSYKAAPSDTPAN